MKTVNEFILELCSLPEEIRALPIYVKGSEEGPQVCFGEDT